MKKNLPPHHEPAFGERTSGSRGVETLMGRRADSAALVGTQAVHDEIRDSAGSRRIEIREHNDDVAALRKDLEVAVHAGGAADVAEVPHGGACAVVHEAECVFV